MEILFFILGLSLGVVLTCTVQINKQKDSENYYHKNYIPKRKIKEKIIELDYFKDCSPDVKIYTISQAHEFAIIKLQELLK